MQVARVIAQSSGSATERCPLPYGHELAVTGRRAVRVLCLGKGCCSLPCGHERALRPGTARLHLGMALGSAWDRSDWPVAEKAPCSIERAAGQVASRCHPVARARASRSKRRDRDLDPPRRLDSRRRRERWQVPGSSMKTGVRPDKSS